MGRGVGRKLSLSLSLSLSLRGSPGESPASLDRRGGSHSPRWLEAGGLEAGGGHGRLGGAMAGHPTAAAGGGQCSCEGGVMPARGERASGGGGQGEGGQGEAGAHTDGRRQRQRRSSKAHRPSEPPRDDMNVAVPNLMHVSMDGGLEARTEGIWQGAVTSIQFLRAFPEQKETRYGQQLLHVVQSNLCKAWAVVDPSSRGQLMPPPPPPAQDARAADGAGDEGPGTANENLPSATFGAHVVDQDEDEDEDEDEAGAN